MSGSDFPFTSPPETTDAPPAPNRPVPQTIVLPQPPLQAISDLPTPKKSKKKLFAAISGTLILVIFSGVGVFLAQEKQLFQQQAAYDYYYVPNQPSTTLPSPTTAPVTSRYTTPNQPEATPSPTPTLTTSRYSTPGSPDTTSSPTTVSVTPQANPIKAYDLNWNLLSAAQLKTLRPGDKVRFTASGTPADDIDKTKFKINDEPETAEITQKKPGTDEFWYEYTIPTGTINFRVTVKLHSLSLDLWFQ